MNMTATNVDLGSVVLEDGPYRDDTLTFTGADTYEAGTILARDSSTGKLIAFVKGGTTNENGIPKTVLTYDVTADGAGDKPVRVPQSGVMRKNRLIIDADGDDTNVDDVVLDQLRDYGITAKNVPETNIQDNQA